MKFPAVASYVNEQCHSPQGECGLKLEESVVIEEKESHSPQGECGLKSGQPARELQDLGHSPQGECGLKSLELHAGDVTFLVTPRKGSAG